MTKQDNTKEMLINTVEGQECRIGVVSAAGLEELYVERSATASHVGNIYKGRITNVEAAIQAAFVDIGLGKNGFLHISDLKPTYFPKGKQAPEKVGHKRPHYVRPPIQECLKRGQELVVQMTKEGIGTKGPTMTTYLSIPGRLLVMMPGMTRLGVSRKVEDEPARAKARGTLAELKLPGDMGFIVRTAGVERSKRDMQRDLNYLLRLWKVVEQRIKTARAPVELYRESDLVTRTIRDVFNADIRRVVCDSEAVARRVKELLNVAVPRSKYTVELYTGKEGLFHDSGLEAEIEKIHSRRVELRSGGSLVIDQTEALVAIDVNSGRFRQHSDAETTALKINLEAAKEIVRQLRLRDLGGVIVIDFIDMREERNRRSLEKTLRAAIKDDRAKTKVLRTSAFGMIELTRQRLGPSLKQSVFDRCPHCGGIGLVKSRESLSLHVMRSIQRACAHEHAAQIEASVPPEVAHYLGNHQRRQIARLEADTGKEIIIRADPDLAAGTGQVRCTNSRGTEVAWEHPAATRPKDHTLSTVNVDDLPPPAHKPARPAGEAGEKPETVEDPSGVPYEAPEPQGQAAPEEAAPARKKSRRGRRGGRKRRRHRDAETPTGGAPQAEPATQPDGTPGPAPAEAPQPEPPAAKDTKAQAEQQPPGAKKAKRRRRKPSKKAEAGEPADKKGAGGPSGKPAAAAKKPIAARKPQTSDAQPTSQADEEPAARPKRPSRRRRKSSKKKAEESADAPGDRGPQVEERKEP